MEIRWPMTNQIFGLISRYLKGAFYQAFCISLMFHFHWWPPQGPPHRKKNCWLTWKTILQYCRWKWTKSVSKELSIKNRSLNKMSNQFERRILLATLHLSGQSYITAQTITDLAPGKTEDSFIRPPTTWVVLCWWFTSTLDSDVPILVDPVSKHGILNMIRKTPWNHGIFALNKAIFLGGKVRGGW